MLVEEKVIKLPVYGIEVTLYEPDITSIKWMSGVIESDLQENCPYCDQSGCYLHCDESQAGGFQENEEDLETEDEMYERAEYNKMMDALESLILGHACAGVNIESPGYLEGIETAVQAIAHQYS